MNSDRFTTAIRAAIKADLGRALLSFALALPLATAAANGATCADVRTGINLAGAESAPDKLPGRSEKDFFFPTASQLRYYREVGFDSLRLPLTWERLQPELMGPLDLNYLGAVKGVLREARTQGLAVVLDLHNYGRYRGELVGSAKVPATAFADLWQRFAAAVKDQPALLGYGLMNEPHHTDGLWERVAQAGVDGVRRADPKHLIYVGGDSWSSAERWQQTHARPWVVDPSGLEVYEAHIYLDADASGHYQAEKPGMTPEQVAAFRLAPFRQWLTRHGKSGVIGEWGVPTEVGKWADGALALLQATRAACLSSFVWAGGAMRPNAVLTLEPRLGSDRLLVQRLRTLLHKPR